MKSFPPLKLDLSAAFKTGMRRDKHYWGRAIRSHLLDFRAEFEAVLSRHLDVEKDEIEMILLQETCAAIESSRLTAAKFAF